MGNGRGGNQTDPRGSGTQPCRDADRFEAAAYFASCRRHAEVVRKESEIDACTVGTSDEVYPVAGGEEVFGAGVVAAPGTRMSTGARELEGQQEL